MSINQFQIPVKNRFRSNDHDNFENLNESMIDFNNNINNNNNLNYNNNIHNFNINLNSQEILANNANNINNTSTDKNVLLPPHPISFNTANNQSIEASGPISHQQLQTPNVDHGLRTFESPDYLQNQISSKFNQFHFTTPINQASPVFHVNSASSLQNPSNLLPLTPTFTYNNNNNNEFNQVNGVILQTPNSMSSLKSASHQAPIAFPQQVLSFNHNINNNSSPIQQNLHSINPDSDLENFDLLDSLKLNLDEKLPDLSSQQFALFHQQQQQNQYQQQIYPIQETSLKQESTQIPTSKQKPVQQKSTTKQKSASKQNAITPVKKQIRKASSQSKLNTLSTTKTKSRSSISKSKDNLNELLKDDIIKNPPKLPFNDKKQLSSPSSSSLTNIDNSFSLTPDDVLCLTNESFNGHGSISTISDTGSCSGSHFESGSASASGLSIIDNGNTNIDDFLNDPFVELTSPMTSLSNHTRNNSSTMPSINDHKIDESIISNYMDFKPESSLDDSNVSSIAPDYNGLGLSFDSNNDSNNGFVKAENVSPTTITDFGSSPLSTKQLKSPKPPNTISKSRKTSNPEIPQAIPENNSTLITNVSPTILKTVNIPKVATFPNKVLKKAQSFTGGFSNASSSSRKRSVSSFMSSSLNFSLEDCCNEIPMSSNYNYSFVYENSNNSKKNNNIDKSRKPSGQKTSSRPNLKKSITTATTSPSTTTNSNSIQNKKNGSKSGYDSSGNGSNSQNNSMESGMVFFQVQMNQK